MDKFVDERDFKLLDQDRYTFLFCVASLEAPAS